MIKPGQIYQQCQPQVVHPARILIKDVIPYGSALVGRGTAGIVTIALDGREVRPRRISLDQLHHSPTTRDGKPRRTGYALEQP